MGWGGGGSSVCRSVPPALVRDTFNPVVRTACTLSHPRILERQADKEAADEQIAGIPCTYTSGYIYTICRKKAHERRYHVGTLRD